MTYSDPMNDSIFGCPLQFRLEKRASGTVVVVSFRRDNRIVFEASPIGGRAIRNLIDNLLPTLPNGKGFLMILPKKEQMKILNEWIGLDNPVGCERRKDTSELTLGVLLLADQDKLLRQSGAKRNENSIKDDERAIGRILEHFGNLPWREVTPAFCASWLGKQTERAKKDCKRIMVNFERLQMQAGVLDELTWENYSPKDIRHHRKTPKGAVQAQIEPVMLTNGQCAVILQKIRERIENGKVNGIDMATLLALSAATDLSYISALNLSDFHFLSDFNNRLVVIIEQKMEKATQNYISRKITEPFEARTLPLPSLAAEVFLALRSKYGRRDRPLCS